MSSAKARQCAENHLPLMRTFFIGKNNTVENGTLKSTLYHPMPMMEKSAESQPEAKKDEKVPGGKQEFRQRRRKNKGCNFGSEDFFAFGQSESERVMQA